MFDLTIAIVTYNSENDIRACIDSIENTKGDLKIEIYVVDNASIDATVKIIGTGYPDVHLVANPVNKGFSPANNQAITSANGDFILLLNPDTVVLPGALQKILEFMKANQQCGVCGPRLIDASGKCAGDLHAPKFWYSVMCLLRIDPFFVKKMPPLEQQGVSGAAMLFRKSIVSEVGLLDPKLFWCEDLDFCTRARSCGYKICIVEDSHIVHYVGQSAKSNPHIAIRSTYFSKLRYARRHYSAIEVSLITCVYMTESYIRWIKWSIRFILKKDRVSKEKAAAYLFVGSRLFESFFKVNV